MSFQIILRNLVVGQSMCVGGAMFPVRCLHLNMCQNDKQSAREQRFMNKLMTKGRPKKAAWYSGEQSSTKTPLLAKTVHKHDYRRQIVLNKLFMRNITEIMATGEVAPEFLGHGIEISRVKITPDFQIVNVYWVSKDSKSVEELEEILKRSAKKLRHELTQLQLMGVMPRIQFLRDNQYASEKEVDRLLCKADYGEEYIPVNSCYRLQPGFSNPETSPITANAEEAEVAPAFPPMRMDVLGLNHADIMAKIKRCKKKTDGHHHAVVEQSEVALPTKHQLEHHPMEFRKETFSHFLMKRRIAKIKEKSVKNDLPEYELYENEVLSNSELYEELEKEEKDYMHEY